MNYKRKTGILMLAATLLLAVSVKAQDGQTGFDKSRLFFGGNFGMSFGDLTFINVSPQAGYRFNQYFAAGAGVNFIYSSYKYRFATPTYRESYGVTGLNIFGRVYPINNIFVQVQPEMNYTWGKVKYYNGQEDYKLDSKFVPSLLGGVGAAIPAGRGAFYVMLQYDVLQQERSPYGNQVIYNFGYNVGL